MSPSDVLSGLLDPSPCFLCEDLSDRESTARYRVPVVHRSLPNFNTAPDAQAGAKALEKLPDLPSTRQLRSLLQNNEGLGLWVSKQLNESTKLLKPGTPDPQEAAGSLLVFPPAEWELLRSEFADWQFDGIEAAFEGLPYTFDDILPFAGPNFSPDRWFLVLRGPMAGNVCWWTHDGDSVMDKPWAADVKAWGDRIFSDGPDIFGGVIRFTATDSLDPAPENAELYPLEYRRQTPERA